MPCPYQGFVFHQVANGYKSDDFSEKLWWICVSRAIAPVLRRRTHRRHPEGCGYTNQDRLRGLQ
ncbi:hypothetical protein [Microseira wollei]|uniref:hypothetical protein n=1 Tax=Microseira wollei TaxID=467598 RepID=UPI001CFE7A72|nr:hypothetical protein [Microseira wollei]